MQGNCPLFSHIFAAYDFIHLSNLEFLRAALITALKKATKTHMKNLDIYREPLKNTKAVLLRVSWTTTFYHSDYLPYNGDVNSYPQTVPYLLV